MLYKVDGWNNFMHVFEVPETFPNEYCFNPVPVNFNMVDWFNPVQGLPVPSVTKEVWKEKVGEIEVKSVTQEYLEQSLIPFVEGKQYVKPERTYIIICDFGAIITFRGAKDMSKEEHSKSIESKP